MLITELSITEKRDVSSAKSLLSDDKPLAKSLIYIKNNNDPKMEPGGTPALTLIHEEDCSFNTTICFKTFNKSPDIPFSCNSNIRPSYQT